ncbi:MAG: hypothetical protein MJY59_01155 [Bacteroidaceae bacterium]|nr:hypothetical protein [Bacteroidaceae bacterium]
MRTEDEGKDERSKGEDERSKGKGEERGEGRMSEGEGRGSEGRGKLMSWGGWKRVGGVGGIICYVLYTFCYVHFNVCREVAVTLQY